MSLDWAKLVRESLDSRPQLKLPKRLKLPVLPQAVIAFTEIVDNPDVGPHELAATIETDASLTSELLRQINSAALGLKQKVASITQAISLLGPRRTKMLVLTSALHTATKDNTSRLIHTARFQRENYVRAVFSREVAKALKTDTEIAYIGGLLQDFLLPLLTEAFYTDYGNILVHGAELIEREREIFGWDHASVAANLVREWGLPDELVACILFHHDIDRLLIDARLHETSVAAVASASCLPESLNQSPCGFDALLVLEDAIPELNALDTAVSVDEDFNAQGQESNLADQLNDLAMQNLEQRKTDRVHHYRKLGNYSLEAQIGEGGMGVVYRAKHSMLNRLAAIKLLHATKVTPEALARFEREVKLTCSLTSPNTVAVYDYGVTPEGLFYCAMEYLEGMTLAQLVQTYGPQPAGRVIHFLRQVCASLIEAHSTGLIHRDLKPENLMICRRGGVPDTLKVLDFGLARVVSKDASQNKTQGSLAGTPRYMPPEAIVAGQSLDARSDLYSLGAVGYYLLTGQPVFPGKDLANLLKAHVSTVPMRPSARIGYPIERDVEELIMRCLEKQRERRPSSAQMLYDLLSNCRSADTWSNTKAIEWWTEADSQACQQAAASADIQEVSKTHIGVDSAVCR